MDDDTVVDVCTLVLGATMNACLDNLRRCRRQVCGNRIRMDDFCGNLVGASAPVITGWISHEIWMAAAIMTTASRNHWGFSGICSSLSAAETQIIPNQ